MSSSNGFNVRTILYFAIITAAVAGAFLLGFWQMRPGTTDQFARLMNIGKNYYEQGNAARAIETFEKAAALSPGHPDVLMNLANAHLLAGQPEAAIRYAQEVIHLEANPAAAHYVMGCAYIRLLKFEDAIKELQTSKDIDQKVNAVSFQLGRAYFSAGKYQEAADEFSEVIQFESPAALAYVSAHYNLGQALVRLGQTDQANEKLTEYQKLLAERPNRPADLTALERCAYTQARVPFRLEQPAAEGVKVAFADATREFFGAAAGQYRGPIGVLDINHRGSNDLFVAEGTNGFRLLINSNGMFQAEGEVLPAIAGARYTKCLAGDLNNDRFEDVVMIGDKGIQAFRFATNGAAVDATAFSNLADSPATDGALVDLDFTGKLDLLLVPPSANALRVLQNLGSMYFKDATSTSGVPATAASPLHLTAADWNNDDIMDLFVTREGKPPLLLLKQRGGTLAETNSPDSWPAASALAVGDLNNDLRNDVVLAASDHLECILGGLTNRLILPNRGFAVTALALVDYDNDGWLDICARGAGGLRLWRNLGLPGFRDVSAETGLDKLAPGAVDDFAFADFDNDGDTDLLVSVPGKGLQLLRNDGGNANLQLKLRLTGNRSNFSGLGVRIDFTSGHWRTMRTVTQLPIEVGVGQHKQIDSVDVHWIDTASPLAEVPVDPKSTISILELLLPTGSCPYLYAWDGTRFRFVTDILGASPAGLPIAKGRIVQADPDEYVWVGNETNLRPRGTNFEFQITEELREVLYLDEAKLAVADHPPGTEVHSSDKMLPGKPFPPSELITVTHRYPLLKATRPDGSDVTLLLLENDGNVLSPLKLRVPQLRGLAEPHAVILDFGTLAVDRPLMLALSGWIRFGGGTANVAASQDPNLPFPFPVLEVETAAGGWKLVDVSVGVPAGKTKTILVDLAGKLPSGGKRLRLSAAFELHWDRIALFERAAPSATRVTVLAPSRTDLHWRGFSAFEDKPWFVPLTPVYEQVHQKPNWLITPSGWCTRYGSVDALLAKSDDALVLINGGDELTLSFAADKVPPKAEGAVRDFFLYTVGWDKDSDFHVLAGTTVEPIPFHGMDDQLYAEPQTGAPDRTAWAREYNTRWVGPKTLDRKLRGVGESGGRTALSGTPKKSASTNP